MFLVSGITGKVGGAVARELLEKGQKVRALARDPQKVKEWSERGVEIRRGDLTDAAALAAALEKVEGAFLMQPTPFGVSPEFPEAKALNASFVEALRRTAPPRLVILSSVGSEKASGLGNITQTHLLEEELKNPPFPIAFVRAGGFIENNLGSIDRAAASGWFDSFLQPTDRAFPMVATADIGKEIARLLTGDWSGRKIVELGSYYSPDDLAQAMSEVTGRPIKARPIPREQWTATLGAMGMPKDKAAQWEEMQDGFNSGWINFGVNGTESVAGTVTPAEVFAQVKIG